MSEPRMPIPSAALAQHTIALGKTRSGKSSKLRVLVEHLLDEAKPVCIIDPKGDWWGLKSSASGKSSGYAIVIFGGEHADVPINEHSGAHIAELVATGNRPCLIDLGGWTVGARTRFFIDFASTLFKLTSGTRYLAIDEVHNFCPKGRIFDAEAGKMLHWANRLASEGQGKGLVLLAASQRPQKVHNDFLTSCETLIACRVIHKADRDAIKDWIDGCADLATGRDVLATLAQMQRTDAWVWSPEIDFGPEQLTWPMFRTYDSFKPQSPDVGKLKGWAEVDLEDVKAKLVTVVKEAEANDPRRLKARIAELERQAHAPAARAGVDNEALAVRLGERIATLEADNRALEQHRDAIAGAFKRLQKQADDARTKLLRLADDTFVMQDALPPCPTLTKTSAPAPAARTTPTRIALPSRPVVTSAPRSRANGSGGDASLDKGQRTVLTAIAQHADGCDRTQIAVLTGYKQSSRKLFMQQLRRSGYVTEGWPAVATDAGLRALGDSLEPLPTGSQLREHWLSKLQGGERTLFEALCDAYPHGMTAEQLEQTANYKSSSRKLFLQKLAARKLIERRDRQVFASGRLFG